ncbi:hypothetical protein DSO57_1002231 [Entomophthora muscae]|uniref:Uncharacterized protein n=1 Tax=Entomophthora muscae TaxID=34485 RepID=A0ACC2SXU0_9FUNG|nr:hypothetical protein DSO57_1002231 [Entomophthora muscae]
MVVMGFIQVMTFVQVVFLLGLKYLIFLMPRAGIEPASSHQAGLVGGGDLPAPVFLLFEANPGAETIPALAVAVGPILSPKATPKP